MTRIALSGPQEGVWAGQRLVPDSPVFRITQVMWFEGEIDCNAFAEAVSQAFSEAEALRVRFVEHDGVPYQEIVDDLVLDTAVRGHSAADDVIRDEARQSGLAAVDLFTGVLNESLLRRRTDGGWAWVFTTHHILVDAYGLGVFTRRVAEIYSADVAGSGVRERQFASLTDVVTGSGQRPGVDPGQGFADIEAYKASGGLETAEVFAGSINKEVVGGGDVLWSRIQEVARSYRLSWVDLLTAVWGMYTARVSGRTSVVLRVHFMMRSTPARLKTPSMLVTILPVVIPISPSMSVYDFARACADAIRAAKAAEGVSEEEYAARWPGGEADYRCIPSINVKAFDYLVEFGDVRARQETVSDGIIGRLDLVCYADPVHGFRIDLFGNEALIPDHELRSYATGFAEFLDRMLLADPVQSILADFPVPLPDSERDRIAEWSVGPAGTRIDDVVAAAGGSVDALVRMQVERTPKSEAICSDAGTHLSFAEFDESVNRLARVLIERGVRVGDTIAVLLPRSIDAVVAVAAVVRTGAAYVPIDPNYPADRVAYVLDDSGATLAVVDAAAFTRHTETLLGGSTDAQKDLAILRLDSIEVLAARTRAEIGPPELSRPIEADDTICVIYTSGTTGRPKGVVMSHAWICQRLAWYQYRFPMTATDRALLKTPFSFDVAILETFAPLTTGAVLVVSQDALHGDPAYVDRTMRDHDVTRVTFVPSMATAFVEDAPTGTADVAVSMITGEVFPTSLAHRYSDVCAGDVVNLYGPTEAGEATTHHFVAETDRGPTVPIGKPVDNYRTWVLDSWLHPVPIGVAGELYIGSHRLADGYLNQLGLTATRFIADPFAATAGGRLYRTGDLVRWNANGALEYLGRTDDQVKIRGNRVELDEVRAALETHPAVAQAAVVAVEDDILGTRLVAYYLSASTQDDFAALAEELQQYLQQKLPGYMVPTGFAHLQRFPTTPNGKLDLKALPAVQPTRPAASGRGPQGHTEETLAGIFGHVLAIESGTLLGVDDDFFRLGGHSILATRAVARANGELGCALTLRDLFNNPTIAALAQLVESTPRIATGPRVGEYPRSEPIHASYGQQALWLIDRIGGGAPYLLGTAFDIGAEVSRDDLAAAVARLCSRHEILRTRFRHDEFGEVYQVIHPSGPSVRFDDTEVLPDATSVDARIAAIIATPIDLEAEFPTQFTVISNGIHDILIVHGHHLATDDQSIAAILQDLQCFFHDIATGKWQVYPDLPVQYADFAVWQRRTLGDKRDPESDFSKHLRYWTHRLDGVPPETPLPLDRARDESDSRTTQHVDIALSDTECLQLDRCMSDRSVTPLQLLISALSLALHTESPGSSKIPVGTPVSLRDDPMLSDLVGYFVNTVVICPEPVASRSFADLLNSVRDHVIDAVSHKLVPFETIVEHINPPRIPGVSPFFQTMAAYIDERSTQSDPDAAVRQRELSATEAGEGSPARAAFFDLVFAIVRQSDNIVLRLNSAQELFSTETATRLLRRTHLFLALGTRFPHLPTQNLVNLVAAHLNTSAVQPEGARVRLHLGALGGTDSEFWAAAASQLSAALELAVTVEKDEGGVHWLEGIGLRSPDTLDACLSAGTKLVDGHREGTALQVAWRHDEFHLTEQELGDHLLDPYWEEWVDGFADAEGSVPEGCEIQLGERRALRRGRLRSPSIGGISDFRAAIVDSITAGIGATTDVVVDLLESDTRGGLYSFPVLVPAEASVAADTMRIPSRRAAELRAAMGSTTFGPFFDDVPPATVQVAIFWTDIELSDVDSRQWCPDGETPISVVVYIAAEEGGEVPVSVDVRTDCEGGLSAGYLADGVLKAIVSSGRIPADDRESPLSVERADRLPLSDREAAEIRNRFGARSQILPLSPLQSGLLYHLVRAAESGDRHTYVSQVTRELASPVDPDRMRDSVALMLDRYPNIRAGFTVVGNGEVQVIPAQTEVPFEIIAGTEWRSASEDVEAFLRDERAKPFTHENPPLIRFTLLECLDNQWLLVMTFEHILMDGWSFNAFLDELLQAYAAPERVRSIPPASFRDYLTWLAEQDTDGAYMAWDRYLDDLTGPSVLNTMDGMQSVAETGECHFDIDGDLAAHIYAAARESGSTVGTLLQTTWALVLARLVGRSDVIFGNTVSGRPAELADADRIIGLLFNTLPFRVRVQPFESVRELLQRVQWEQLDVMEHSYASLTEIQRRVGMGALFDTLFVVQNFPHEIGASADDGPEVTGGGLNDATHYPITFAVNPWEAEGVAQVHVRLSYRVDVFSTVQANDLLDRYVAVLEKLVANLDSPVGTIPILTDNERAEALKSAAGRGEDVGVAMVADLLRDQVSRSTGSTALVAGSRSYTFGEFDAEVNRYARLLISRGVGPEHRVALFLPRDERMVIAMFAVFAVGAAYVPIDPEHPDERIDYMLEVARPTATLATDRDLARLGATAGRIVNLDEPKVLAEIKAAHAFAVSDTERGGPIHPDLLAYVIFTSGSTGRPKGVAVGYRGLTNMYANHVFEIFDRVVAHQAGRRLRIAHTTSFSFDASWEQLFWLLNGHAVYIIDEELRREPAALMAYYDEQRIDGFDVTPSYGQLLVDQGLLDRDRPSARSVAADAPGVVFVSLGGEAVPDRLWQQLRQAPGVESYNLYGPTEYTINALGADLADSPVPNVGTPIFNTRAYILDETLDPALPGVPGELYLAGDGIARGYWGQPALTAERFPACPFEPGNRMYRTGDLARRTPDGNIAYLGRADDQVKIRGYRIEPGEVADVLADDPAVAGATVVARADHHGVTQLYGYLVAATDVQLDVNAVRKRAGEILPEYMIPAGIAEIEAIPLNVNGKVDLRALPSIEAADTEFVAATTATERVVVEAAAELLGVERLSVNANFFQSGGNSLLAMRLVARINSGGKHEARVKDVFGHQTPAELAVLLEGEQGDPTQQSLLDAVLITMRKTQTPGVLFCFHEFTGFATMYSRILRGIPDSWSLYGIQDPVHAGMVVDFSTITELANAYADVIESVVPDGELNLLGWSYGGHIAFAVANELVSRGRDVAHLVIVDALPSTASSVRAVAPAVPMSRILTDPEIQENLAIELIDEGTDEVPTELFAGIDDLQRRAIAVASSRTNLLMSQMTTGHMAKVPTLLVVATEGAGKSHDYPEEATSLWDGFVENLRTLLVREDHNSMMLTEKGIAAWITDLKRFLTTESLDVQVPQRRSKSLTVTKDGE
ncbi:amino acid adenylation domain-containing protein [Rhodococcus artemisiae]|uniref:Amino acid adenylation domain-containing protein n=1 Tax=Rhodococcus artemisiae TaxID=714159 RepID=A0ABU7LC05_9NOCA|nr:amino acid adenylation domain-containing protein [Rhodococcus artemisiae]MEE2059059.1 amino acid adenylation domain-containing protein [Rhodococcus artemisiae]